MTSGGASLLAYAVTSLSVLITYFIFFPLNAHSKYQYSTTPAYLRPTLSALVLVHTLFILYELLLNPPTNLFMALDLPLPYPTDSIRSLLLMLADDPASGLPSGIERVLTRLGSAGMRLLYVRFGHEAIATCEYCTSWSDFALFVLPRALWDYLRETLLIGILTLKGTRHSQHRTLAVGALCVAALFEAYLTLTVTIRLPKEPENPNKTWQSFERLYGGHGVVMWHDTLLLVRRIIFLILPITLHFVLKPSPPTPTLSNPTMRPGELAQVSPEYLALNTLQGLMTKLQLLRLTGGAIPRHPTLRARAEEYWTREQQEGEWMRNDVDVREVARGMGLNMDEGRDSGDEQVQIDGVASNGPFLRKVKIAAQNLITGGFVPSPFWKPPPRSTAPPS